MTKIYACLLGEWVCLNDDPNCVIGKDFQDPTTWYKENAPIVLFREKEKLEDSFHYYDRIKISYKSKEYHIHPIFIQLVVE